MAKGFRGSAQYWQARYARGRHSGMGSKGAFAEFKAGVLNPFVAERNIQSVVEWGCGDGLQLARAHYPQYLGIDVSATAVALCRKRFAGDATKRFVTLDEYAGERAELALSLDVIYHLVEDEAYEVYMRRLFRSAYRYVIIYSSNKEWQVEQPHIRHRTFTDWVATNFPGWTLTDRLLGHGRSPAQFFFYKAQGDG